MFGIAPHELIPDFQIHTLVTASTASGAQIAPANPDRFALIVWGSVGNTFNYGWQDKALNVSQVPFTFSGGSQRFAFPEWATIVTLPWIAVNGMLGQFYITTEIVYQPKGGVPFAAKTSQLAGIRRPVRSQKSLDQILSKFVPQVPIE